MVRKRIRALASDDGFGLLEILTVVALVGIITGIAVPAYTAVQNGVKNAATQSDLASNRTALTEYSVDNNGAFPAASGFNPKSAATGIAGYGWSQSAETTGYHYVLNAAKTAWCLDMTNVTLTTYRISTNSSLVTGTCSTLSSSSY